MNFLKSIKNNKFLFLQRRFILILLLSLLPLSMNTACTQLQDGFNRLMGQQEEDDLDDPATQLMLLLGLLGPQGDYYSRMYYLNPLLNTNFTNSDLVAEATSALVTAGKKKLVLVHGWHFDDRDGYTYPNIVQLKDRVMSQNWSDFFQTDTFNQLHNSKSYDLYAYDYLTSNGVDINGARFRARMDDLFGAESGNVVIYAHSMGGLVTRFAVYEGAAPAYLNKVITTGTPFHGSPWASGQFSAQASTLLTATASFLTATVGGQDLRWDNFDGSLPGASNEKLTTLNAKTDRDSYFYAFYGSINGTTLAADSANTLTLACTQMSGSAFEPSDCIVPQSSATLSGNTLSGTADLGDYDHIDVKMTTSGIRTAIYNQIP